MTSPFLFFVGIDWGSTTHHVCLLEANGSVRGSRAFPHGGAGQAELVRWLLDETGAAPGQLAVAIETPHGPVVEGLLVAGFAVFAIGPAQIRGSRRRYVSSGAKDDPRDAWMLARALRADPDLFRRVELEKPLVLQLRNAPGPSTNSPASAPGSATRSASSSGATTPNCSRSPTSSINSPTPGSESSGTRPKPPHSALKLRVSTLAKLLKKHGIRRLNGKGLWEILHAPALTVAPGAAEAAGRALQSLFAQAHTTNQLLAQARQDVRELLKAFSQAHPDDERPDDMTLFRSLPGVGGYVLSTLFAEAFDLLQRRDYPALRARSGVAPVSIQSGNTRWEIRRLAVQHELRNALYHWARVAAVHDPLSKARYRALRARGHSHGRALRTVGDRLLAVACAMLKNGTLYDPKLSRDKLAA